MLNRNDRQHVGHGGRWFAFLVAYWMAFLVNTSFDVFLEGPMGGIWFWTLVGTGLGSVVCYRSGRGEAIPLTAARSA